MARRGLFAQFGEEGQGAPGAGIHTGGTRGHEQAADGSAADGETEVGKGQLLWALTERPYSRDPQAVGAVNDRAYRLR